MMSRYFGPAYLFRSLAVLGSILLSASLSAYTVLYRQLSQWDGSASLSSQVGGMVWFAVALYGIVASFLIIFLGVFATHRVAGPLYRLEKLAATAAAGAIPPEVHLREGDEMHVLAEAQGRLFAALAEREREIAGCAGRVERAGMDLAAVVEDGAPERRARGAADLRLALHDLQAAARPRLDERKGT
jgi:hypothetical protein